MCKILSLIIPVYNVEAYIKECINSIILQLDNRVEVIVVNDGTPDNSMKIIEQCLEGLPKKLQDCFIILNQENQGQSVARNNALNICTGKYIAFLDSDDLISDNYFSSIFKIIDLYEPDIIRFKASRIENRTKKIIDFNVEVLREGYCELNYNLLRDIFNLSSWFPWLNIYKAENFKNIFFPEGVYFEDANTIPEVFLISKNIYFFNDVLYFYRINESSSLLNLSSKNVNKIKMSFEKILEVYEKRVRSNKLYSASLVSLSQGYICFILKNFGWYDAFLKQNKIKKYMKNIDKKYLMKRGNRLYYSFGLFFILILSVGGKLK